eukprot:121696-Pyramimonas_sp.AAC.1
MDSGVCEMNCDMSSGAACTEFGRVRMTRFMEAWFRTAALSRRMLHRYLGPPTPHSIIGVGCLDARAAAANRHVERRLGNRTSSATAS